jgi:tRNA(Ile)-lysidine synthase
MPRNDLFVEKIRRTIEKHRMISRGDRVVVAVSGGPDSVCLLSVLHVLANDLDLTLHVAHLDHRFRGAESAADARFVEGMAKDMGIAATVESRDVPAYCAERGLSAQAGAREVRYAFLRQCAKAIGAQRIALGHTANDQAETLLMRLVRGAGMPGLSAVPPVRENIIRPLIGITRTEVLAYLQEQGIDFRTDPSNRKPVYTRNRVRHEMLPVLERFNPNIIETLAAEAALLRDENEAIEAMLPEIMQKVVRREEEAVRIRREEFSLLLPALQRRVLRKAIELAAGDGAVDHSWIRTGEALGFAAEAQSGRSMEVPGGLILEREYGDLVIRAREQETAFCVPLAVPGEAVVPAAGLAIGTVLLEELPDPGADGGNYLWQAVFDYDKISLPLYLRNRRTGDRFCPAGMGGRSKKLQDYFVDEKVPKMGRSAVPLLATDQDVVWIMGMRTDGRFLPGPGTKRFLVVTAKPLDVRRDT